MLSISVSLKTLSGWKWKKKGREKQAAAERKLLTHFSSCKWLGWGMATAVCVDVRQQTTSSMAGFELFSHCFIVVLPTPSLLESRSRLRIIEAFARENTKINSKNINHDRVGCCSRGGPRKLEIRRTFSSHFFISLCFNKDQCWFQININVHPAWERTPAVSSTQGDLTHGAMRDGPGEKER